MRFSGLWAGFSEQLQGVVAIDGRVLRRSFDRASGLCPTTCLRTSADKFPAIESSLNPLGTLAPAPGKALFRARRSSAECRRRA